MLEKLLIKVSAITKKYEHIQQKTGVYFNIFEIANISEDEVTICRILYELINPKGRHFQGDIYLRLFVRDVLGIDFSEDDYKSAKVFREYLIDNNRRIDLYIETDNYHIPIEVKINANDQVKQCYDYYKYAKNSDVFYLTLYGYLPSPEIVCELNKIEHYNEIVGYDGITQISFSTNIMNWLNNCIMHKETIRIAPIREILLQLKDVVGRLTWQVEDDVTMEIVDTILISDENIKSAFDIEKSLPFVKKTIMFNFLSELKLLFEKNNRLVLDFDEEAIADYYLSNAKTYPCITVVIKDFIDPLMAILYLEINYNLYYSFAFAKKIDRYNCDFEDEDEVKKKFPQTYKSYTSAVNDIFTNGKKTNNLIFWDYVYNGNGEKFNFKNFSPSCIELATTYKSEAEKLYTKLNQYINLILAKME